MQSTYDLQNEVLTSTDQRGVKHSYTYDYAGDELTDTVTNFGNLSSTNGSEWANEIATSYTDLGQVYQVTTFSGSTIKNQVQDSYDGWGDLVQEYQADFGAVGSGTPSVQYLYGDGYSLYTENEPSLYLRLTQITYPDGSQVSYGYGNSGTANNLMSQLTTITDSGISSSTLASYNYLGADTLVTECYTQPDVTLDYSANNFAALDQFGRVISQDWTQGTSSTLLDGYSYLYNSVGDRTSQVETYTSNGTPADGPAQAFGYDLLDRLTSWTQTLVQPTTKTWSLDSLGNNLSGGHLRLGQRGDAEQRRNRLRLGRQHDDAGLRRRSVL